MNEVLKSNKKYTLFSLINIPFKISPGCTLVIIINRIIKALLPSFTVLVTAYFVDTALSIYQNQASYNRIITPLILYMVIILYRLCNRAFVSNFINVRFDMKAYRSYRSALIEKRSKLDYKYIENNQTWDLITRTCKDPLGKISGGMRSLLDIVGITINIGSLIIILMTQVWWAALVILLVTIPLLILAAKGGQEVYEAVKESEKHNRRADYYHKILSGRENIEERAMFGYTNKINEMWYEKFECARKISLKVDLKYFIRLKTSSIITVIISISIIGFLLIPLSQKAISIGMFMGLTTATLDLVQMMSWHLAIVVKELAKNKEYLNDLTAFMSLSETEGAADLPALNEQMTFESLEFVNVSFKYPDTEKYILKDFNLKLEKNLHYAFVGVNGAGKTTITKLLTGMYDNYTGDIFINNKNLRDYKLCEIKALFSVVYQDFAKYYISFKDNVLLGNTSDLMKSNSTACSQQVLDCAYSMGLKDVIDKLPYGIDSYLGKIKENGTDVSGGQWQRIAVTRALYNPALVRILDEPTAALDPIAESNIYNMFGKISTGKTTIFITHRLGAAKLADEIIVIDKGRVAEKGNHNTLLSLRGIYAKMYESQRSWYK